MTNLGGILPAVVTPLDSQETFRPRAFEQLLEHVYAAGAHGVYVCGQTGEGTQQPLEQRKQVAEVAVKNSTKGKAVIVHVGACSTAAAVELARHAGRSGAAGVSSLPPPGVYGFGEVHAYYSALAAAVDLPLLLYYFPALAPSIQTLEDLQELCRIPNVAGLKFTDSDLYRLSQIKAQGAVVFNGSDQVLVAGLLMGADGGIGSIYNLVPEWFVEAYELARAGQWEQARLAQAKINRLIRVLLRFPLYAAIKKILTWSGIDCGGCVSPRQGLKPPEEDRLRMEITGTEFGQSRLGGRMR